MPQDVWKPELYARFRAERSRPFFDLLAMVRPRPGMRVVDLGCGTGELTAEAHKRLRARSTLGIDSSQAMLEKAAPLAGDGLSFAQGDIARFEDPEGGGYDLVLSNAALHWVPDHPALLPRLARLLAPGGQLVVQVPANQTHVSHRTANELAREEPYATALRGYVRTRSVLTPVEYALQLKRLGLVEEEVRLQVYVHELSEPADIVEWCRGTLLTDYEKRLPPDLYQQYVDAYRRRIVSAIPDERPYLYTYQRILFCAQRPG
ncbi:MAG TPA: methyltransferase domain-containing protein [Anaeromyxobacteraceae bacterium]|nr:methyltransferase domain-containing protein [Anaeromyxobacteraceae bacterium]